MNKILLNENTKLIQQIIADKNKSYDKSKILSSMLSNLGLVVDKVDNWNNDVAPFFVKSFPNATLEFNLRANGVEAEYLAAAAFHHLGGISYEPMTAEKEAIIRETQCIYADSPAQIEAYELLQSTIANLNRLKELSPKFNLSEAYLVSRVFSYDRKTAKIAPDQKYLISAITSLK
jgi:hypothetical protein